MGRESSSAQEALTSRVVHYSLLLGDCFGDQCVLSQTPTLGETYGDQWRLFCCYGDQYQTKSENLENPDLLQHRWPLYIVSGQSAEEPCLNNNWQWNSGMIWSVGLFYGLEMLFLPRLWRILFVVGIRIVLILCNVYVLCSRLNHLSVDRINF